MAAKIPKKYYFPQKKRPGFEPRRFRKGVGYVSPSSGHRSKTRRHPADKKDAVLAPVTAFPPQAKMLIFVHV